MCPHMTLVTAYQKGRRLVKRLGGYFTVTRTDTTAIITYTDTGQAYTEQANRLPLPGATK